MKALVRFGYQDYCFDVAAVPFIATATLMKTVRGGYHPDQEFEGVEIKLIPDEKCRMTEEEQQKDYRAEATANEKLFLSAYGEKNQLAEKVKELTAALDALKSICPHPAKKEDAP